jgi:hypothetical protein
MAIGNWGTDIVFRVSDKTVFTFDNLARTVGAEWATHSRVGKKDQTEFLRPKLQKVTFSIYLDATYGVRPRTILDRLADCCETGTVNPLVFGGKRMGRNRWKITDLGETWDTVLNRGELVRATVNVTMEEYL